LSPNDKQEKLKKDFESFLRRRAELTIKAVKYLAEGRQLNAPDLFEN